ncbi:MAG: hypothetical protein II820_10725 [Ruminiclostridium sp.]|nr:hypothetical protein [Ruminiclostridium sp.]
MKKTAALLAILLVLAAGGCGGNNTPAQTSAATTAAANTSGSEAVTSVDENGVVSMVMEAPEREDTTEESLKYFETNAPAFKKYLDMRRSLPMSFESTVTQNGEEWKTGLYIKDDTHQALYSIDPSGARIDVVYSGDKIYQVEHARKTVFTYDCGEEMVAGAVSDSRLSKIYLDDVMESHYWCDQAEYEGNVYDRVIITTGDEQVFHYFDTETGKLAYSVSGDTVTRVDLLENAIINDDIFNIPTDYEQKKYSDLLDEQLAEEKAAAEAAAKAAETTTSAAAEPAA